MKLRRIALGLGLHLASGLALAAAQAGPTLVAVQAPRDSAHHLGDVVELQAWMQWPQGWELVTDALPLGARDGQPVELRGINLDAAERPGCSPCRRLTLRWQIFKAVRITSDLSLPALTLQMRRGAELQTLKLPASKLAVSPQVPWEGRGRWHESARPGLVPLPYDTQTLWWQAAAAAGVGALALAGWAWARGLWLPRTRQRPFAAAWRAVRRSHGELVGAQDWRQWHRAFDLSAGRAVMAADLPAFFASRPGLAPAAADSQALFAASQRSFFLQPDLTEQVRRDTLAGVLRRLAAGELGRRSSAP